LTVGVVSQKDRLLPTGRGYSIPGVIQAFTRQSSSSKRLIG
jgi:hypothetical protein